MLAISEIPGGGPQRVSKLQAVKYAWIESHRDHFSVSSMCRLLGVSSSGLHAWRSRPPSQRSRDDARLVQELRARHTRHRGKYGRPRLTADLREAGIRVNQQAGVSADSWPKALHQVW